MLVRRLLFEHGGFINKLAETDLILSSYDNLRRPLFERQISRFLSENGTSDFDPWTTALEQSAYRSFAREFIHRTFAIGLRDSQRWGAKEIRYHRVLTARFLTELFPEVRIVVLHREPDAVVASSLTAPWSLDHLRTLDRSEVGDAVRDTAYVVAAISSGFKSICRELPHHTLAMEMENIKSALPVMWKFLAIEPPDVSVILTQRLGETAPDATLAGVGRLELRRMARDAIATVRLR